MYKYCPYLGEMHLSEHRDLEHKKDKTERFVDHRAMKLIKIRIA